LQIVPKKLGQWLNRAPLITGRSLVHDFVARRENTMKINLKLFPRFREVFQMTEGEISLKAGANVRELLNVLCDTEERSRKIFDSDNRALRPNVVIRKNGRFIVHLNWLDTALEENDVIEILTFVSGG
jgi:thiamine biosynthesis protein ThiS